MSNGHDRYKEQLPAYSLGSLDPAEKSDFEHHLEGCAECQAELAWLEPAAEVLASDIRQYEPSPGLRSRVMAEIDADLAGSEPETAPAPARESRRAGSRPERKRWFADLFRPVVLGAAATALIFGVVLGIVLNGGGSESPSSTNRQVLTGQTSNGAEAVMVASDGTGTLKMTNLKKLDERQVYQAWIQRGQTVEPTDSLFLPRRNGTATASIPDLNGVTAVMVSAEPSGGSPQPTTAPVITVSIPS